MNFDPRAHGALLEGGCQKHGVRAAVFSTDSPCAGLLAFSRPFKVIGDGQQAAEQRVPGYGRPKPGLRRLKLALLIRPQPQLARLRAEAQQEGMRERPGRVNILGAEQPFDLPQQILIAVRRPRLALGRSAPERMKIGNQLHI